MSMLAEMARATHAPRRPQVVHQLFFQYATRLNEQTTVDGLVRHAHALVVGIPILQPPGNLLGRPVQNQFTRNDISQLGVSCPASSAWFAKPIAKLVRPHHGHDKQDGRHGVRSLGSLSRWHDSDHGRSRESTSRKRFLAKYLLAQRG